MCPRFEISSNRSVKLKRLPAENYVEMDPIEYIDDTFLCISGYFENQYGILFYVRNATPIP